MNQAIPSTRRSDTMKAIVQDTYGQPDVLELRDSDKPVVGDADVLVRVHAASIHLGDWILMRGVPYVLRIKGRFSQVRRF
jgi:NADPH:quinone reductase-like Zn-dependent oxidoreductase